MDPDPGGPKNMQHCLKLIYYFQVAQVKGAGPPPAVPSPGDAALLALVRQSAAGGGGGGGGVRLYTEQDLLEGRAKGHHQMQQQQRPRFSHPAIPPPLLRVSTYHIFFISVVGRLGCFFADPDPT